MKISKYATFIRYYGDGYKKSLEDIKPTKDFKHGEMYSCADIFEKGYWHTVLGEKLETKYKYLEFDNIKEWGKICL